MYPKNSNRNIVYATDKVVGGTSSMQANTGSNQYIQRKFNPNDKNIRKSASIKKPFQYESSNRIINSRIISNGAIKYANDQSSVYQSNQDPNPINLTGSHHIKNPGIPTGPMKSTFDKKMRHMSEANIKNLLSPNSKYALTQNPNASTVMTGTGKKSHTPLRPGHLSTQNLHSQVYGNFGKSPRTTKDGKIVIVSDKKSVRRSDYESSGINIGFDSMKANVNGNSQSTRHLVNYSGAQGFTGGNVQRVNPGQRLEFRGVEQEKKIKRPVKEERNSLYKGGVGVQHMSSSSRLVGNYRSGKNARISNGAGSHKMIVSRQNVQSNNNLNRNGSITPSKLGLRRIPHPDSVQTEPLQFHEGAKIEAPANWGNIVEGTIKSPEKENQRPIIHSSRVVNPGSKRPTTPQPSTLITNKVDTKETLSEMKERVVKSKKPQYDPSTNIVIATGEGSPYFNQVIVTERKDQKILELENEIEELREIVEITNRDKNIALKFNELLLRRLDDLGGGIGNGNGLSSY